MTHGKNIRTSEPTSTRSPLSTGLLQRHAINQAETAEVPRIVKLGYHSRNVCSNSPLNTRVRICKSK